MEFKVNIDAEILSRFTMALQLTGEDKDIAVEALLKAYIAQSFSRIASSYKVETQAQSASKAAHKIAKWAEKPTLVPSKIIRAYLSLEEELGVVSYNELQQRCSDAVKYPTEYISNFPNNFAQMKFDDEKSYGKVFEVDQNHTVTIYEGVREEMRMNKEKFKNYTTMTGYLNKNNQRNMGKTDMDGTLYNQKLYKMHCEICHHDYYANGSDIFEKKCPACQGGADTKPE